MSTVMKISPQGQIRIPKRIMEELGMDQGDYVEVEIENGQILLKPRKLIDPSQAWHWTKEWQKDETDADDQIEKNELSPEFVSAKQGNEWLKK